MKINKEVLKKLKPCTDRWENYLQHYNDFDGTLKEFLELDKITVNDKVFVIKKLLPTDILIKWAILCANSVLHFYTEKYPNDKRVSDCLQYLLAGDFSNREDLLYHRYAAITAAASAAAAYDAAYAVAYTAYAASAHAATTATSYAASAAASASAAYDAVNADQWIVTFRLLIDLVESDTVIVEV